MVERPILFSGPMVRAILEGRKFQTRRVVNRVAGVGRVTDCKESDTSGYDYAMRDRRLLWNEFSYENLIQRCPYGQVGDVLWVREAFAKNNVSPDEDRPPGDWIYRADLNDKGVSKYAAVWRPSIHMPRIASRILLEITGVRVERLQHISDLEAKLEGIPAVGKDGAGVSGCKQGFVRLWTSINGPGSWHANPVVWVIIFTRMSGGIDGLA